MRKRCHRQIRKASPPMLINRGLCNDQLEMMERQFVEAFAGGYATAEHFDSLADMRNLLTIAAAHIDDATALAMCDAMRIPMGNIRDRFAKTGRMGVTGDELTLMREFVTFYKDWWLSRSVALYEQACEALQKAMREPKAA